MPDFNENLGVVAVCWDILHRTEHWGPSIVIIKELLTAYENFGYHLAWYVCFLYYAFKSIYLN